MPHLLVDITSHGYGHVAQTAPVVNELAQRISGLRVTVRSAASFAFLKERFSCEFQHIALAQDFGMKMVSAVEVDVAGSMAAYRAFHADWAGRVARAAEELHLLQPDVLLANVPYLSLAAAHVAGVPAVGMCSLNWADIYQHYSPRDAASRTIHAQMLEAYNSAEAFLKIQPSMPMPEFRNARSISPVVRLGKKCREAIVERVPSAHARLVMVAMGGIEFRLPMENWPQIPDVHWLIPQAWGIARDDMTAFESLGLPFSDALASCDAALTKPGYGTFAEAACAGVPVLYVSRGDWPEEPYLVEWLRQNGVCLEVERDHLWQGKLRDLLAQLWNGLQPVPPPAYGAVEAAQFIQARYF